MTSRSLSLSLFQATTLKHYSATETFTSAFLTTLTACGSSCDYPLTWDWSPRIFPIAASRKSKRSENQVREEWYCRIRKLWANLLYVTCLINCTLAEFYGMKQARFEMMRRNNASMNLPVYKVDSSTRNSMSRSVLNQESAGECLGSTVMLEGSCLKERERERSAGHNVVGWWISEWVSEWVGEWVGERVSEWVAELVSGSVSTYLTCFPMAACYHQLPVYLIGPRNKSSNNKQFSNKIPVEFKLQLVLQHQSYNFTLIHGQIYKFCLMYWFSLYQSCTLKVLDCFITVLRVHVVGT